MTQHTFDRSKGNWFGVEQWDTLSGGLPVYRGFSRPLAEGKNPISPPTDRQPKNIPVAAHRLIDQWFLERFGFNFRTRALFGSGSIDKATIHAEDGEVGIIRPSSDFMFCWSPHSYDLFGEYAQLQSDDEIAALLEKLEFTTENLDQAIMSGHEIMLASDSFVAEKILHI